jgi:hypothetical protein
MATAMKAASCCFLSRIEGISSHRGAGFSPRGISSVHFILRVKVLVRESKATSGAEVKKPHSPDVACQSENNKRGPVYT